MLLLYVYSTLNIEEEFTSSPLWSSKTNSILIWVSIKHHLITLWVQTKPNLSYTFCQIFAYYDVGGGSGVQNCKACLQFQVLLSSSEIANLAKERVYIWHQNHFAQQKIVSLEWARMSPRV